MYLLVVSNLLVLSAAINIFLIYKLKSNKTKKTESYEVRQLLTDLAQGGALVEIRRMDPSTVFLRSPRENG